jgi:formate-dependent nitrite reductase membrane component NrfD
MNYFVADPEWGVWIILYFYLGGIAAGCYFTATLIDLLGSEVNRGLARLGYWVAFPLICVCGLFLIIDLDRPERFWHMLFKSEIAKAAVKQAYDEGWPLHGWHTMSGAIMFKYWSPMSVGSWALLLFGLCSCISFLGSLWPRGWLERILRYSWFGRVLQVVGCLVGFFVASYTGALLSATNQPLWSDSVWIAPLFLTSAASTGIALMILVARWRGIPEPTLEPLERADLWALGLELVVLGIFLASLSANLLPVLGTWRGLLLVVFVPLLGVLAPLVIHLRLGVSMRGPAVAAAVLALFGGLLLRYTLVRTPAELLERGPVAGKFSPEDGRTRGFGSGADPGNHGADVIPQSKVFDGK